MLSKRSSDPIESALRYSFDGFGHLKGIGSKNGLFYTNIVIQPFFLYSGYMHICVPLKERNISTLLSALKKANKIADIIEIWFDELENLDQENIRLILKTAKKPLIYKVSKVNEKTLNSILSTGKITYLDLDLSTKQSIIGKIKKNHPKMKLIISYHDFKKTPELKELQRLAAKILKKGADIIKIATKATMPEDSLTMLSLLGQLSAREKTAICICMGVHGQLTRLTGHLFGNYLMYAPMRTSHKTAAGQITAINLKRALK